MSTELSKDLGHYESIVERGLNTFIDVGNALMEIRDGNLYSDRHKTFEDYCHQRFDMSRSRAYQLIGATKTVQVLSKIVDTELLPVTESHVRALQNATSNPKEQVKILKKAAKSAPKDKSGKPKITASAIKQASVSTIVDMKPVVAEVKPVPIPPEPPTPNPESIDDAMDQLMRVSSAAVEIVSAVRLAMESRARLRDGFDSRIAGYRKNHLDGLDVQASALFKCSSELRAAWLATKHGMSSSNCPRPVETLKRA